MLGAQGTPVSGDGPFFLRTAVATTDAPHEPMHHKPKAKLVCQYLCKGTGVLPGPHPAVGRSQVVSHRHPAGTAFLPVITHPLEGYPRLLKMATSRGHAQN